jgi:hypothetical protein
MERGQAMSLGPIFILHAIEADFTSRLEKYTPANSLDLLWISVLVSSPLMACRQCTRDMTLSGNDAMKQKTDAKLVRLWVADTWRHLGCSKGHVD